MRVHITLDETLVRDLDELAGPRGRSSFIEGAIRRAVESEQRWKKIWSAVGSISDHGHEWDDDPAEWVRQQRRSDPRRVG